MNSKGKTSNKTTLTTNDSTPTKSDKTKRVPKLHPIMIQAELL
jgi:hypothetical protein